MVTHHRGPTWPADPSRDAPPLDVLSLMSGTSLDGMDLVLARLQTDGLRVAAEVLERVSVPYPVPLRERLVAALEEGVADVLELTLLHAEIGLAYADACAPVCERRPVDLIALSGQNVYHVPRVDPARGWRTRATLQLGEAAHVLERCRVPVACDFRQSDIAAGGQGAPLVAFGDLALHQRQGVARAVHNLGGIANLTWLPPHFAPDEVVAFDTGPGNCLIDEAVSRAFGDAFDRDGRIAAAGRVDDALLERLMRHPYLSLPFPKTTGREVFSLTRLERDQQLDLDALAPADLVATLTAFTAQSVALAYRQLGGVRALDEVLLAGGGAANPTLVQMLRERIGVPVHTFESLGMVSTDREALAFGVMAYFGYLGRAGTLPGATGARRAVVAGKYLWPHPFTASVSGDARA
jgi:anhydro-N-acetylmuramic acid kinase